jgi:membrane-associated phospholipid phosphatase
VLTAAVCSPAQETQWASRPDAGSTVQPYPIARAKPESRFQLEKDFVKNLAFDQRDIWTSPLRLKPSDTYWLAPAAGAAVLMFRTDRDSSKQFQRAYDNGTAKNFSDMGLFASAGIGASFYAWGLMKHDGHAHETGVLAGEAFADAFAVDEALKFAFRRQRPSIDQARGRFLQSGGNYSFPSSHATLTWATATVIAHEYPGTFTSLAMYGLATGVSAARVAAGQHFVSDVFVGGLTGYLIGRHVYNSHHDTDFEGANIGTFVKDRAAGEFQQRDLASTDIPLDSWVYSAIERLQGRGYAPSAFLGLRPWTRLECARITTEIGEQIERESATASDEDVSTYAALERELQAETSRDGNSYMTSVDSVYFRYTGISGRPLTDGYHFGETIINDYGRPYAEGTNLIVGTRLRFEHGRFAAVVVPEYQQAPSAPALPQSTLNAIASVDATVAGTPQPVAAVRRGRLVEAYVTAKVGGFQFSFGKQPLWWGPGESGPFLFSTNAEPIPMLRISNPSPAKLPGFFGFLGPVRSEFFIGKLEGQHFVFISPKLIGSPDRRLARQPIVHGQKFSFKPTPNLEFSVSKTTIYGGPGLPLTFHNLFRSIVLPTTSAVNDPSRDPGDRRSAIDFTYRVPGLRKYLVFYNEAFTEDEPSPISAPRRSAFNPGIFIPTVPGIPKLELRGEGGYTDLPGLGEKSGPGAFIGTYYANIRYKNGYTNYGQLMGSWIGRQGRGIQGWATYHLSPHNMVQFSYRKQGVDPLFLQGGKLEDFRVAGQFGIGESVDVSAALQYERNNFPLLDSSARSNSMVSLKLMYKPKWRVHE